MQGIFALKTHVSFTFSRCGAVLWLGSAIDIMAHYSYIIDLVTMYGSQTLMYYSCTLCELINFAERFEVVNFVVCASWVIELSMFYSGGRLMTSTFFLLDCFFVAWTSSGWY